MSFLSNLKIERVFKKIKKFEHEYRVYLEQTVPPRKASDVELERMERNLIEERSSIFELISKEPGILLKITRLLIDRKLNEDLVTNFHVLRNFIYFQTQSPGASPIPATLGPRAKVSSRVFGLSDLIERLFPWSTDGHDLNRIPVSEWMEMAECGREVLKKYIDDNYGSPEEAEELFEPFYDVFIKTARRVQENPFYLTVIQLVHTVDRY